MSTLASMLVGNAFTFSMNVRRGSMPAGTEPPLGAELGQVGGQGRGHLDHRPLVLAVGLDRKDRDDRLQRGRLHGVLDRVAHVGADLVLHVAQQDVIAALLPAHDAVAHRLAGIAVAGLRLLELGHPEHLLAQLLRRDLEEDLVVDPMDEEQTGEVFASLVITRSYGRIRTSPRPDFGVAVPSSFFASVAAALPVGPEPGPAATPERFPPPPSPVPYQGIASACVPRSIGASTLQVPSATIQAIRSVPPSAICRYGESG